MQKHIREEKDHVFIKKEAYDEVLHDANLFTNMEDVKYTYHFPEGLMKDDDV